MVSFTRGAARWWLAHQPLNAVADEGGSGPPGSAAEPGTAAAGPAAPPVSFLDELATAVASARAVVSNFLDLAALEGRRAALSLIWMVALGLGAMVLSVTAWAGFMSALVLGAVALGVPWLVAVLVVSIVNLLAAGGAIYVCIGMSRDLLFSATRRQVAGKPAQPPPQS